jgi:acetyl esterase
VNTHRKICEDLALKTRYAVVFPEYALAPEAKWPIQHKQCFQVIKDVVRNGLSYGLDPKKLAVVGDSAGGSFSALV